MMHLLFVLLNFSVVHLSSQASLAGEASQCKSSIQFKSMHSNETDVYELEDTRERKYKLFLGNQGKPVLVYTYWLGTKRIYRTTGGGGSIAKTVPYMSVEPCTVGAYESIYEAKCYGKYTYKGGKDSELVSDKGVKYSISNTEAEKFLKAMDLADQGKTLPLCVE